MAQTTHHMTRRPPGEIEHLPDEFRRERQMLPAIVNAFVPGLGQILQGRFTAGVAWFLVFWINVALIFAFVGVVTTPIIWLLCIMDAAKWQGREA